MHYIIVILLCADVLYVVHTAVVISLESGFHEPDSRQRIPTMCVLYSLELSTIVV